MYVTADVKTDHFQRECCRYRFLKAKDFLVFLSFGAGDCVTRYILEDEEVGIENARLTCNVQVER